MLVRYTTLKMRQDVICRHSRMAKVGKQVCVMKVGYSGGV